MLRLSYFLLCATAAAALVASTAALAQQGGLSVRITDAGKQLDADVQACRPINLGEYQSLLSEAAKNKQKVTKAAKKGMPVDEKQADADLAAASALFNKATAAMVQQCLRSAQSRTSADTNTGQTGTARQPKETAAASPFAKEVLAIHNAQRAAVGSAPLRWNPELEAHATARAGELARLGELVHAPREGRGTERENIMQVPRSYSTQQAMGLWTKEAKHFVPGKFPAVSDTGDVIDVVHYTQMISYLTTDLGCAAAQGGAFIFLVCRYNPNGNRDGKPILADRQEDGGLVSGGMVTNVGTHVDANSGDGVLVDTLAGSQEVVANSPAIEASNPPTFTPVADANGPSLPPLRMDANGHIDTKVPPPELWAKKDTPAKPIKPSVDLVSDLSDSADETLSGGVGADTALQADAAQSEVGPDEISGGTGADTAKADNPASGPLLYDNGVLGDGLIYGNIDALGDIPGIIVLPAERPAASGVGAQKCPVDFGAESLSQKLDQAEIDLNNKLAAGAWIDPADYEELAEKAEQSKTAAMEEDRATSGTVDPALFNQNADKAQRLLKTAQAAAAAQTVDTNVEQPDLQGKPALIDPNAPSPIDLKLSDCVM